MKTRILFTGIIMLAAFTFASAQSETKNATTTTTTKKQQTSFVDKDNNGICDNYENGTKADGQGKAYRNSNGKQNCNSCGKAYQNGKGQGNGQAYKHRNGQGDGQGKGLRNGQGNGNGQYVDANKNGVCDNREQGTMNSKQ